MDQSSRSSREEPRTSPFNRMNETLQATRELSDRIHTLVVALAGEQPETEGQSGVGQSGDEVR